MKTQFLPLVGAVALASCSSGPQVENYDAIRLNQIGFYQQGEKIALVEPDVKAEEFEICKAENGKVVYQGKITETRKSPFSQKERGVIRFSDFKDEGTYFIRLGKQCRSYNFDVKSEVLRPVTKAALKAFYYQRTAMPIEAQYAGVWSRESAHPDDKVIVHPSAASKKRPAGTVLSSSKGWYDAGDYNKYIVNSAYSVALMLDAYKYAPDYYNTISSDIPESSNQTPDLLDEVMYNLDWMLTMQDPEDGGVYHKLTTPNFEGFIKPSECQQPRYVVMKSTAAALDFAASMALASRVYSKISSDYPDFSEKALAAARKAYEWSLKNPAVIYDQNLMNEKYDPDVTTGAYDDKDLRDEWFWASVELFASTKDSGYLKQAVKNRPSAYSNPTWGGVASLGIFTLCSDLAQETASLELEQEMQALLLGYCNDITINADSNCFIAPFGQRQEDFGWGSLCDGTYNQTLSLLYAYDLTKDQRMLDGAVSNNDYVLGRNALGYCFVTGLGGKSPMNPHHRLSASDSVVDPLPGFLVGGPNPAQQDKCNYPSSLPDESYVDDMASYASNEIAINWNAALVAVEGMIESRKR